MIDASSAVLALLRWLAGGALDGTLYAGAAALALATLLRRSSARLQALIWRGVLLQFVLVHPFELHLPFRSELHAFSGSVPETGNGRGWLAIGSGYVAIVLLQLGQLLLNERRLRRRISSYPLAPASTLACIRAAAAALSLRALPEVRVTDAPLAPFTLGPLRPVLVLPRWLCVPGERLDAVLLHELAHLKHRDHWWMCLERVIVSLFFFWPPVFWVNRQLALARELACDEHALQRGGFSAASYGRHLVAVVRAARERLASGGALAIGRGPRQLERRIDRLMEASRSRYSGWREAAALGVLGAGSLLALRPSKPLAPSAPAPITVADESSPDNMCVALPEELLPSCAQRALLP